MQTLLSSGQAEQTLNKSRFIARAMGCADEREINVALRQLLHEHSQAHHLAYAFRLHTAQGIVQRFHDAGEPSGTAGKPVLQHLEGKDLVNVCVGVIRYYGGINLGTGGLARAYGGTAKLALDAARIAPYVAMGRTVLTVDYDALDPLLREIEQNGGSVLDREFTERVRLLVNLPVTALDEIRARFGI